MDLDHIISRQDILDCIFELKDKRNEYVDYKDNIGHNIWMMTNYAQGYLINKFGFDPFQIEKYKEEKKQLYLDL